MNSSNPVQEFHFPCQVKKFECIRDFHQFQELLQRENNAQSKNIYYEATFVTDSDGVEVMNLGCKQCNAYFKYWKLKRGNFNLKDFNHYHRHEMKQVHSHQQTIRERIYNFLLDKNQQDFHTFRGQLAVKYQLTQNQLNQLINEAQNKLKSHNQLYDGKEIDELSKKLKNQRYSILADSMNSIYEREGRVITKSIVIVNDQMESNYKKYGDTCFLAVEDKGSINRWHVGALMGIGRDMEMCLFGLILVKAADVDHLKGMLTTFFKTVIQHLPKTIITQNSHLYDQTIAELREENFFQCEHVYDYAMYAEKTFRNSPKMKKIYHQLCKEPVKEVFFNKLQEYYNSELFHECQFDLEELVQNADKLCLSQVKNVPLGPYRTVKHKNSSKKMEFSIIRLFHKTLLEKDCNAGKHLYNKVKSILGFLNTNISDDCAGKNIIMNRFPQLNNIRVDVSKNVMDYLMSKVYASMELRQKNVDEDQYQVFAGNTYFYVKRNNQKWNCQCQESVKTMLPCVHEVFIACRTNSPFDVQLGRRWTNQDERLEEQMRKQTYRRNKSKRVTLSQFLA